MRHFRQVQVDKEHILWRAVQDFQQSSQGGKDLQCLLHGQVGFGTRSSIRRAAGRNGTGEFGYSPESPRQSPHVREKCGGDHCRSSFLHNIIITRGSSLLLLLLSRNAGRRRRFFHGFLICRRRRFDCSFLLMLLLLVVCF